ncbi:MAG: molybdopterin-dependent oxidoreductase [Cyclobacteriaceae bacterium]|nr:molybdopterin-dependent oxidoreductase [Cyclobacteriaceae bacterium]
MINRRKFVQIATLGSALVFQCREAYENATQVVKKQTALPDGAVPSACWQCVSRCAIVGFTENGRLRKIEGNPLSMRNEGKICAKGQAGIQQYDHPDRLTYPLRRIGERGSGKWERISWEEALDLLMNGGEIEGTKVKGLKTLRAEGTPEKFLFHYGRMTGTDYLIIKNYFLKAYGTASIGNHDSICSNPGAMASMLTGDTGTTESLDDARIIFNFGRSLFEAGFDHVPFVRRLTRLREKGARLVTFDVRLSNTAAKSDEWVPVKPGTDLAVALALCHVLIQEGLYNKESIEQTSNVTLEELKDHLKDYTPEWAEKISGVPAERLRSLAMEYGKTKPGVCLSLRGAFMHHNGVQAQRAIKMLDIIAGNTGPEKYTYSGEGWRYPFPRPQGETKKLPIFEGEVGKYAFTSLDVSHQIVNMIDKGPDRPELYMVYCHNPVYSNGQCDNNIRLYKDTSKIPFLVAVDVALSETTELADLVLPDASYLERWTCERGSTPEGTSELYVRQPLASSPGETRNFVDVACQLADKLDLNLGFSSAEEFVRETCNNTPGVKEAGGFEYIKGQGIYHGEKPEKKLEKRKILTLRSKRLEEHGFSGLPDWMPVPGHQSMKEGELVLTTFKVNVQTHSRTQNCKWLTELYHENPAWINTKTATILGIKDGDMIRVRSGVGEIAIRARVTQGIHPQAVAISNHGGHWAWGEYASGKKSFVNGGDIDSDNKWWDGNGAHVNRIIPNIGDPISGSMCWNDTVVVVEPI